MCTTCGCSASGEIAYTDPATGVRRVVPAADAEAHDHMHGAFEHPEHAHSHEHIHPHGHIHPHEHAYLHGEHDALAAAAAHGRTVVIEQEILAKNQRLAERNRGWLAAREVLAINLMGSPGAGKTSILEATIRELRGTLPMLVLEGDQATTNDADRIHAAGAPVVQINTGTGCHLDAAMVARGLREVNPPPGSTVFIENVGNLVCPALFDLGEHLRVAVLSVAEGDDKPVKYPHMFRACDILLISKIDLLRHVRFDPARCAALARQVNPRLLVLQLSAESGEGMDAWYAHLAKCRTGALANAAEGSE